MRSTTSFSVRRFASLGAIVVVLAACTTAVSPAAPQQGGAPAEGGRHPERTLVVAVRIEPQSLAAKPTRASFVRVSTSQRIFNGALDMMDDRGMARAYLA